MEKLSIIGTGSMATALAMGLKKDFEIEIIARNINSATILADKLGAKTTVTRLQKNTSIEDKNLILCTKPNSLSEIGTKLEGKANMLISIMASTPLDSLKKQIKATYTARAMPNISASVHRSTTTITGDIAIKELMHVIFASVGDTFWVDSEKELDIATAVAGSGTAYLALVAEAMMDGGVKQGLKRQDAKNIVTSLFGGFAPLLENSHPALIKDKVMSPAGTTAAGYSALEAGNVRASFINAIEEAFKITQK